MGEGGEGIGGESGLKPRPMRHVRARAFIARTRLKARPMRPRLSSALVIASCGAVAMSAQSATTQYPVKPIRVVIPFSPGGTPDLQLRILSEKMAPRLGQPFVHDYRPGAAGNIGMDIVAHAAPDGYTLIIGTVGSWAVNPHLYKLNYDVMRDFAPIINVGSTPAALVVHPSVAAKSVKELIALAKQKPGELNYGSTGVGGFGHMCAELFMAMTGTRMTHVSYKGAAPALTDLVGGHIQVLFNSAIVTVPQITAGKVRALGTTGASRIPILPDVPTIAEAGLPGYENSTWSGIAAPAKTPRAVVERLNRDFAAVLDMPEIRERFTAAGSTVIGGTPGELQTYLKAELAKYAKLIKGAGIRPTRE
jgi:tripartite-type tricarboxylate transporter receptor subunit TctC